LSEWASFFPFSPATADEAKVSPELVRFGPDIEPIVRLIEDTPQDRCIAVIVEQFRKGLPYRHLLAALYLAAIRAAKWYAGMHGYDHSAYVVHSAYQLALDLPAGEQLLPAFYALNGFKGMQKVYPTRKDGRVLLQGTIELTGDLPAAEKAVQELHSGMKEWDTERAERAVVALIRSRGRPDVLEPLWCYASRDWFFIGHLAILAANSCRLLETIGWQHAEPVLRYVVAGLAGGSKQHAERHADVRPYWANIERVEKAAGLLPGDWAGREGNEGLTKELLAALRDGKGDDACDLAVSQLVAGKAQAGAIWDAVHLTAGELVLSVEPRGSRPDGNALHANTSANALHYAFRAAAVPETRLLLTLQALAWMDMYRKSRKKGLLKDAGEITAFEGSELPDNPAAAIDVILTTRTAKPHEASRLAFAFAQRYPVGPLLNAARSLLPTKSSGDPHDIKFPVAIFEDLGLVSARWRPHLLSAAAFSFWGSDRPDSPVMQQVREALGKP
jgi:hypothetical protein